jgi:hypothetical protein
MEFEHRLIMFETFLKINAKHHKGYKMSFSLLYTDEFNMKLNTRKKKKEEVHLLFLLEFETLSLTSFKSYDVRTGWFS